MRNEVSSPSSYEELIGKLLKTFPLSPFHTTSGTKWWMPVKGLTGSKERITDTPVAMGPARSGRAGPGTGH